ncbi:hypothetical protein [Kitasatospora sp. NPDC098663]|uniref:hypothetical protein n=1 Tax=Kitasatospora sp. NPDC098663 TaxID=3364096 RepID=UPI00380499D1
MAAWSGATLTYGTSITLMNELGGQGGYLDVNGSAGRADGKFNVSTNPSSDRTNGRQSSVWKVISASGKSDGAAVMSGDKVWLVNQLAGGQGGYLDVNGGEARDGAKFDVSTTESQTRIDNSAKWRLLAKSSTPSDGKVRIDDTLHLLNDLADGQGGFLDVNGTSPKDGAKWDVSTTYYTDRGAGSGSWKIGTAP